MDHILIYGAYGYTGKLIVKEAIQNGYKPVLAGRNEEKLKVVANTYKLLFLTFSLNESTKLDAALKEATMVIHCAGPFSSTAIPMAEACLRTKTHYLDISGEYDVFQKLHDLNKKAIEAGIMLLPGAGFDVVPSDCLAQHLYKKLPSATHLMLAFSGLGGGISRGTAKTMIEGSSKGQVYREDGILKTAALGKKTKVIDYGPYKKLSIAISWGDIVTSYYSTGIPNIEVYTGSSPKQIRQLRWMHRLRWLMKMDFVKTFLKKKVDKNIDGPSEEKRAKSQTDMYGKVWSKNNEYEALLTTPNGYTLTAKTTILITGKILKNDFTPGYQTPATAYGKDLISEIEGCKFS